MKPFIGISVRKFSMDDFYWIGVHKEYISKIEECGGIPILLCGNHLKELLNLCDGILVTGGSDITKEDKEIYDYALKTKKPYLGICMGMQLMVGEENLKKVDYHNSKKEYAHKITIIPNTLLSRILKKTEIFVNSRHKEGIKNIQNYVVSAYSEDGVIEAIEKEDYPFHIGVQWHPESMKGNVLFYTFINKSKQNL